VVVVIPIQLMLHAVPVVECVFTCMGSVDGVVILPSIVSGHNFVHFCKRKYSRRPFTVVHIFSWDNFAIFGGFSITRTRDWNFLGDVVTRSSRVVTAMVISLSTFV